MPDAPTIIVLCIVAICGGFLYSRYREYSKNPIQGFEVPQGLTVEGLLDHLLAVECPTRAEFEAMTPEKFLQTACMRTLWFVGPQGLTPVTGFFVAQLQGQRAIVLESILSEEDHATDRA